MARMYAKCLLVTLLIFAWVIPADSANGNFHTDNFAAKFKTDIDIEMLIEVGQPYCNQCKFSASAFETMTNARKTLRSQKQVEHSTCPNEIAYELVAPSQKNQLRVSQPAIHLSKRFMDFVSPASNGMVSALLKTASRIGDLANLPVSKKQTVNPLRVPTLPPVAKVVKRVKRKTLFSLPSTNREVPKAKQASIRSSLPAADAETMDTYWQYYSDCDRWNVVFNAPNTDKLVAAKDYPFVAPTNLVTKLINTNVVMSSVMGHLQGLELGPQSMVSAVKRLEFQVIENSRVTDFRAHQAESLRIFY